MCLNRAAMALVKAYRDAAPQMGVGVRLAENSTVVGDVELGDGVNLWYGSVLRGDVGKIVIGKNSNLQDLCCVHMTKHQSNAVLGDEVSVGHAAVVHGAIVEDGVLVGMGAVVMDNARIGEGSIVGAGALVTGGVVIPPRSLVVGRPGKVVRPLRDDEWEAGRKTCARYLELAAEHFEPFPAASR